VNSFLVSTLAAIEAEAEATRGVLTMREAVEILIVERVERGILSAAEAATIRAALCVSCGVLVTAAAASPDYPGVCRWCGESFDRHPEPSTGSDL